MHVEIHDLDSQGKDRLMGKLHLKDDKIVSESSDKDLMQAILNELIYDPQADKVYTAENDPEAFLRALPGHYRSAYLRAKLVDR